MDKLDEDLDDSNLFCKSLIQKRKAFENINPKQSKQLKLTFYHSSSKTVQPDEGKQKDGNSSEEGIKSIKEQNRNSKRNESESNYFCEKNFINSCPLCLKVFRTDSTYSAHMKQCAKTHKMTTQQLLEALELQKKQLQERRDLGLYSKIIQPPKKITKKKIKNEKECYDLALGVALSKSLAMCEVKPISSQEVQKATLEEFGFNSNITETSKKKNENKKYPLLKSRTSEERQKIIVEKVAVILLDEDQEKDMEKKKLNENSASQNHQAHQLWSLGENDEKRDWYVSKLKLQMLEEENSMENDQATLSDHIEDELAKLNLPQKEIYKDWNKMINNSSKSDLIGITKDNRDVYLHSLVLFARCPEILEKDFESIFQKYYFSTVLIFLEYLYCGTLNGLIRSKINNLYDLAVELKFNELMIVLNKLKNNLLEGSRREIRNSLEELSNKENNTNNLEITVIENKKVETYDEKDLFTEDVVDLTQSSPEPNKVCKSPSENESNAEKSYWTFIQHEKDKINLGEIRGSMEEKEISFSDSKFGKKLSEGSTNEGKSQFSKYEEKEKDSELEKSTKAKDFQKQMSEVSATKDLVDIFENQNEKMNNSNCITLSSGSESKTDENIFKPQRDPPNSPSSTGFDFEVPYFDPYENFHCFSEEQFSPVGLHSQSLLIGDISAESLKSQNSAQGAEKQWNDSFQEEPKRTVGYCSTPVTVRQISKIKSSEKSSVKSDIRKRCRLSGSRILRKSLGLQHKMKRVKGNSSKKRMDRRRNYQAKEFAEALTNSILNELSKPSLVNSPSVKSKNCVEITPTANKEDFGESVTPYPNYSNMGESMLKEQLTKYGLKKNLAKSKAKKILRHIYEELHPLYNSETGKIVKMIPTNSQNLGKKTRTKRTCEKKATTKQNKKHILEKNKSENKEKDLLNSSKESEFMSDGTILSFDGPIDHDSGGSEFNDLSETLTQSTPSNPVDLPSAFDEFIQNNSEYYQKILLYEPIWLEELQKNLKEVFKKHFKISDIMDFLDQKCITFRSAAQVKNLQKRNEKKKGNLKRKKNI